jgi:MSHA pilin protein MshD
MTQDGASFGLSADAVLKIDVTVTASSDSLTLTGYRFRYAPNAVP